MSVNATEMSSAISMTTTTVGAPRQNPRQAQIVGEDSGNNERIRKQVVEEDSGDNEYVRELIAEMQSQLSRMNVSLAFTTYGDGGEHIAIVVANKDTGEVIREIPSKEIQNLHAKMSELTGMILDGKA